MRIPNYPRLWASGLFWNLTRWMSVFICSYLVNRLTEAPFLVQAVGSAFFAPMFFGGAIGGIVSDRFDRRRTMLWQLVVLTPIALVMAAVVLGGEIRAWMVYPFMLAVGVGGVVDMTSRRALVFDFVGEARITNALAMEQLSMTLGSMGGAALGGAIISVLGLGEAYIVIALLYVCSFMCLASVSIAKVAHAGSASTSVVRELREAFRYVSGHRPLVSILGVTVIMNLFFFSFMPMVPVFADRLHVGAFLAGVLASANPAGSVLATLLIAKGLPWGRGIIYVGGSAIAMCFLFLFAATTWYPIAFLALLAAGAGVAGFATMQSVLVLTNAEPAMRGRAMGLLSMAIGALPFSMLVLGGVAQIVGSSAAVMGSVVAGLIVIGAWAKVRPEAQRA